MLAESQGLVDPNVTIKVALLMDICKVSASFRFDQLFFSFHAPFALYTRGHKCSIENNSVTSRKERLVFPELKFLFY